MKILIIMPWIKQGGAELIAVQTAYQLQKLDHRVHLAALFVDTSQMGEEAKKIEYVTFGPKIANLFKKNKFFLYFLGPFFLFWLVLKETKRTDILFPHSLPSYWIASVMGKLCRKKVVWLCNEPPKKREISEVPFLDFLLWQIADSFLDKVFIHLINEIIVYSKIMKKEVKLRYDREAKLVRLGVDFDFFWKKNGKTEEFLKKKYNLLGKFVLLMVGKLHPQKNQRLGIEVLAKILPKIGNAVLVLVGEGPDREKLKIKTERLKIGDKVIFAGFCPPRDVRAWYGVSDLVLFPSVGQTAMFGQSWGFVPFEALCQRKVSIVSKSSGAAEVLGKEKIGIICQPRVEDFSQAVLSVFEKRKEYEKMGKEGYNYVKDNLSWERWGKDIEKWIKEEKKS